MRDVGESLWRNSLAIHREFWVKSMQDIYACNKAKQGRNFEWKM